MSKADDWIETRVRHARKSHPTVTEAVTRRMKTLLNSKISERQLSSTELTSIAKLLISDMAHTSSKAEAKR